MPGLDHGGVSLVSQLLIKLQDRRKVAVFLQTLCLDAELSLIQTSLGLNLGNFPHCHGDCPDTKDDTQ